MKNEWNIGRVLLNNEQLGRFPMQRLKRVDKPTNLITDNIQRINAREKALAKATRGDYGPAVQRESPRFSAKYPLNAAQMDVLTHLSSIKDNEVAASKAPIPEDPEVLSRHIKRLGYFLKADIMGICRLPKSAVYSHDRQGNPIDIDYQFAIVIVMGMENQTIKASQGYDWITNPLSYQCYQYLPVAAFTMANYIRRLGYPASADCSFKGPRDYQVLMPPLLLWASIGEVSRPGIILNPFLGLYFKAAAVLTNLPLVPDKPIDFGLQDFCQRCKICAKACPSKAIRMGDKVMYNGYETWKLNEQRCASFCLLNQRGTFCGKCVKVCPWSRPYVWQHNLVRWAVDHSSLARKFAIKADTILGYGKAQEEEKWWFDLEEVDGIVGLPRHENH